MARLWLRRALVIVGASVVVFSLLFSCAPNVTPTSTPTATPTSMAPPVAAPAEPIKLKLSNMHPANHYSGKIYTRLAEMINERSKGQLVVTVFPAGQIASGPDNLDAVKSGAADMGFLSTSYFGGKLPVSQGPTLPFLFSSHDSLLAAARGGIGDIMQEELDKSNYNVKALNWGPPPGWMQFFGIKKTIKVLEDFRGLQTRAPGGLMSRTLELLGTSTVSIASPEIYTAAQRGIIDSMTTSYQSFTSGKLDEVAKYITVCDIFLCMNATIINKDKFNNLPKNLQKIIVDACYEADALSIQEVKADDKAMLELLKSKGLQVYSLPAEEKARWKQAVLPVYEEYLKSVGAVGQKLLDIAKKYN